METLTTGTLAGTGTFRCTVCDYALSLAATDPLPTCPGCGGSAFARGSFFTAQQPALQVVPDAIEASDDAAWLGEVRAELRHGGQYLVFEEDGEQIVHELEREWTRVGRSLAADIRFDDPTVSRRHALVVRQPDGVRVLDDRSLNGVFVNGERIEWRSLGDGDELVVGRHRLHFVDVPAISGTRELLADEPQPAPAGC